MSVKAKQNKSEVKATKFCCRAPDATNVFLAGTFNGWDTESTPMERDADGKWVSAIELSPGRHEYKFFVDGQWHCEPNCVLNDYGTMNQIIDVG